VTYGRLDWLRVHLFDFFILMLNKFLQESEDTSALLDKVELGGECEQIGPGRRRYSAPPPGQQGTTTASGGPLPGAGAVCKKYSKEYRKTNKMVYLE
jgi:hypothetical protein